MSELRFAVVREDPEVEVACVSRYGLRRARWPRVWWVDPTLPTT